MTTLGIITIIGGVSLIIGLARYLTTPTHICCQWCGKFERLDGRPAEEGEPILAASHGLCTACIERRGNQ